MARRGVRHPRSRSSARPSRAERAVGPPGDRGVGAGPRKGIGLTFPNGSAQSASAGGGDATELGDAGGSPGKSCLFFSTVLSPGIGLAGERANGSGIAPHLRRRPVRSRRPVKIRARAGWTVLSRPVVPITAAGLRGEQPLVEWNNVGKGSRQKGSVTSGEGLALRAGSVGLPPEAVGRGRRTGGRGPASRRAAESDRRTGLRGRWQLAGRPSRSSRRRRARNSRLRTGTDKGNPTV